MRSHSAGDITAEIREELQKHAEIYKQVRPELTDAALDIPELAEALRDPEKELKAQPRMTLLVMVGGNHGRQRNKGQRAMWTPEVWDRVRAGMRAHLEASPKYKDHSPEERNAMLESMMERARERFDEWPPKPMPAPMVMLMGQEETIEDEFKVALRAHVLHRVSEERIESKVGMGGMTREQVIDSFLGSYADSDLGERLKAYHAEHGVYPEPLGFSRDIPGDVIGEVKAKAWEMAEMMFEHHGAAKVIPMREFLPDLEQRVRDFYADHGQLPALKRDPSGHGFTMGTQAEIDQLPPPPPVIE